MGALSSILSSERLPLATDGSRDRGSQPEIMRRDSKLEVYIGTFPSEVIKETLGGRGRKNVGVISSRGHQENIDH